MKKILLLCSYMCCSSALAQWQFLAEMDNPYLDLYNKTVGADVVNLYDEIIVLEEKYKAARAREMSTANKLLGGLSIGAAGIGGMMAASALAEQSADEDAETAMRAYLSTFSCRYADKRVVGGEQNVDLPGGNELMPLYSEYVNLANDLKVRKAALDMKPGVESEPILESATTGLYDDVSVGKTSGVFASLARALQNPNGSDAAAWAAQKEQASKRLNTGATVGGIGAVGGAVGNLIINKDNLTMSSQEVK